MPTYPLTANTMGQMITDITDELARGDLTGNNQIQAAIGTAIEIYQKERFWFSESRDTVFNTVAAQEFYAESAVPGISTIMKFDYVVLYLGQPPIAIPWIMNRATDKEIEILNQNGLVKGQPYNWAYYNEQLRLGPIPDTIYTIRIAAHLFVPPPAANTTLNNPWMTNAERLIRSRAKYELLLHVIRDFEEAEVMATAVEDAFTTLKGRTNKLTGTSIVQPMEF